MEIGLPSVYTRVNPPNAVIVPSVAMKEGIFPTVTSKPFKRPAPAPISALLE